MYTILSLTIDLPDIDTTFYDSKQQQNVETSHRNFMFRLQIILPNSNCSYIHPLTSVLEALKWTSRDI
jgi:hypothetical protein